MNEAGGNVGRERTISGKISGIISVGKFYEAGRKSQGLIENRQAWEVNPKYKGDEVWSDVVKLCESLTVREREDEKIEQDNKWDDVVLQIAIEDPENTSLLSNFKGDRRSTEESMILGSQTLYDLRGVYRCLGEYLRREEDSYEDLNEEKREASLLYIEGIFYVDGLSKKVRTEYIDSLKDWVQTNNVELSAFMRWPPVSIFEMKDTTLMSLRVKLNYPYLFSHGKAMCTHTVYFRKIMYYNGKCGIIQRNEFPYILKLSYRAIDLKCCVCRKMTASFVTSNDSYAESESKIGTWCKQCFEYLHPSPENNMKEYNLYHVMPSIRKYIDLKSRYIGRRLD